MLIYDGRPQEALSQMEIAKSHNPKPPAYYHYHIGQAYYVLGVMDVERSHFATAIGHLQKALEMSKNFRSARAYLVAVYIELGQTGAAENEMKILQSMGRHSELFEDRQRVAPYRDQKLTDRLLSAWQQAGAWKESPTSWTGVR
jgi:tetratricopeptide (TPR) repeat protein